MFRVSLILKNAREDKQYDYHEVSKKLKVPVKYLEALENEQIKDFPPDPYCSLIVKDYADFLGLNGDDVLTLFRRDFDRRTKTKPSAKLAVNFTPQFTFRIGIIVIVLSLVTYLSLEYIKFNQPPSLKVDWPQITAASNKTIEITGITDNEATVKINDDLIIVDSDGSFKKQITLGSPSAKIIVESKSPNGKTTVLQKNYQFTP